MIQNGFMITSDECELLMAFEAAPSIEKLSSVINRDMSNISRSLNRVSSKLPVIEKQAGRWVLTEQGRKLNQHTRDAIQFQRSLFQRQSWLRVGTNREFAARILGAHHNDFQALFPESQIRIMAFESGTEQALLEGAIDISIDCERPFSPEIAYKAILKEPIIAICSPDFKKKNLRAIKDGSFFSLPHLLCDRLTPDRILLKSDNSLNILASFNDIATTRAACKLGNGWALLPRYAVRLELLEGSLNEIDSIGGGESTYGVWWLRSRKHLSNSALQILAWLKKLEL